MFFGVGREGLAVDRSKNSESRRPLYSIGAASKLVGVPIGTLRSWHDRYRVVVPERSPGGQRLYSRDQLEQLRFVASQVAAGLSAADAHRVLAEQLTTTRAASDAEGKVLILLAERDPYAAELAEYFLLTEGYKVVLALNADDAIAQAEQRALDLAIVDLLISGARGLELCARLRDRSQTPIVAISTFDSADAALHAGASVFLQKPIKPLQLVSAVRDLLGRSAWTRRTVHR
jgi:CheY-like chemotaxis protein